MGDSFVLFYVSIVISHRHFHCGNRGHTQNTDFPWVKSNFPVGKRSSGTAANNWPLCFCYYNKHEQWEVRGSIKFLFASKYLVYSWMKTGVCIYIYIYTIQYPLFKEGDVTNGLHNNTKYTYNNNALSVIYDYNKRKNRTRQIKEDRP